MTRLLTLAAMCLVVAVSAASAEDALPSPAEDLKVMQGNWKVTSSIGGATTLFGETPEFIQNLSDERLQFRIEDNRLSFACIRSIVGKTATLTNDMPLTQQQEQVAKSVRGDRLLMLTLPDGKGLLASYKVSGDRLTLRYPAGCCSRSGNVISLERVK